MEYFAQLDAKRRDGSLNRPNNTTHSDTHNTPDKCSRDNGLPRPNPEGVIIIKRDPIIQAKKISERGKMPIEIIPVYQRFVNLLNKKNTLLQLNEKMTRYPEFMKKRSNDRINNLARDRNISRARKF
ncbi:MAG: hypothetical protein LBI53_07430 [Candidatus Peribacteria bacterium]|jgi:hypothetical protein|nr:hypothetical protein [Candidatus Peribacteria bacterium]